MRVEVEELFLAAADLPEAERDAFLEARCSDPSILAEVRSLLEHDAGGNTRLRESVGALAGSTTGPRRFGPYRATSMLGVGGMGAVYLAERDDGELTQQAAIKVAQISLNPALFLARFLRERQILAELSHPYIGRLLDAGTADDDTPYLVMEYIDGQPLDQWCDAQNLDLKQRVSLFLKVCEGVEHAHRHLIVHRDLKPANILVTPDGTPKLLDFGVAKVLGGGDVHATSTQVMTPAYASPEQVRGGAITTATDVYGLGALLYDLLVGRPPHDVAGKTPAELQMEICERECPRPGALRPELKGDLENILLMALRKEPERRYRTVQQLAADLNCWLNHLPVSASPDSLAYRAGRFWRRNRLAVAAALVTALALVAGAGVALYQARRADRRFQEVRKLANVMMFDIHDRIENLPGATEARNAIMATSLQYLESLRKEAAGDPDLLLDLANGYRRIGDVQGNPVRSSLGDTKGAASSYERAREILLHLDRAGHPKAVVELAWVEMQLAVTHGRLGDTARTREHFRQACEKISIAAGRNPRDKEVLDNAVNIYSAAARAYASLGDPERTRQAAQQAVQFANRAVELDPKNSESRASLSLAYSSLGIASQAAGNLDAAVDALRQAVSLREALVREEPGRADRRRLLMIAYGTLGGLMGEPRSSAEQFEKAVEIARWLLRQDPADRKARADFAQATLRLGASHVEGAEAARGVAVLLEAHGIVSKLSIDDSANTNHQYLLGYIDELIATGLELQGRRDAALRQAEAALNRLAKLESTPDAVNARRSSLRAKLIVARLASHADPARASRLAAEVSAEAGKGLNAFNQALIWSSLGKLYLQLGQREAAARWLEQGAQAWRSINLAQVAEPRRQRELRAIEALRAQ